MGEMTRLMYLDDSGSVDHGGLVVYGWVEVTPQQWRPALRTWLDLRKRLFVDYGIPVSQELHATEYINGRSRVSVNPPKRFAHPETAKTMWKDLGREVAEICLATLRDCQELRFGAVYRKAGVTGSAYAEQKYNLYEHLVADLNAEMAQTDCFGFIMMDGDDPHYRAAHRTLPLAGRHLIEDPAFHDSRHSQWTQMADLVAYSANIQLNPYPGNAFGWHWYRDFLAQSDPNNGPKNS